MPMKLFKLSATLLILSSSYLFADEKQIVMSPIERREQLLKLTNMEINTIGENNYQSIELAHRLFELHTERVKLLREKENAFMLQKNHEDIKNIKRDDFFTESNKEYIKAQNLGVRIIKDHPSYTKIADIYYTLAINSRDFGTNKETENYLKQSINYSASGSKSMHAAKVSLAEYYYNEKKYANAITYYKDVLENTNDEWHSKHLYNASWCELKERNFSKALALIKESFESSKNKKYVSMKEQVLSAIGIFYVEADRTHEGISFFEKNTTPSSPHLILMAHASMNKNNFKFTEEILGSALNNAKKEKEKSFEMKVRLAELEIFKESKRMDLFFTTTQSIVDLATKYSKIDQNDINNAINRIKDVAGFMQINLVKDKTKENVQYNKDEYRKIIKYFDALYALDKGHASQYRYFQGETTISIHQFAEALSFYIQAIKDAKKLKDPGEYTKKSFDAILTIIDDANLSATKKTRYLIFTYKNYLSFYPVSEKSQALYQKLFNIYFETKKIKKSTNTLLVYKANYQVDEKIHREMLSQILNYYISNKKTDHLAFWVNHIEKGYLNFDNEYIQSSIAVLGNLLFEHYHLLEKDGKVKEATAGYEDIFDSKKYPLKIKAEAAYALSAALLDLNQGKKSYTWLLKSLAIFADKDLEKITNSIYAMAKNYRFLQHFEIASELSKNISKRFCQQHFEQKDSLYELYVTTNALTHLSSRQAIDNEIEFKDCKLSDRIVKRVRSEVIEMMVDADKYVDLKEYFVALEHLSTTRQLVATYLKFKFFQNPILYAKDLAFINPYAPELKLTQVIDHYKLILAFREKSKSIHFEFSNFEKFDASKYNFELDQYLSMLAEIEKEAVQLSKESTPEEIFLIREVLSGPYLSLKKLVDAYSPKGVDAKYVDGFKKGMRQISESLLSKTLQFDKEKVTFLEKNNYFFEIAKHATFDSYKSGISAKIYLDHDAFIFVNTMDVSMSKPTPENRGIR
jgi:hypothetical protein